MEDYRKYENSVLLIIDMQRAFTESWSPLFVAGAPLTIRAIDAAAEKARRNLVRVIWVRRIYAPDGSDMEHFRRDEMEEKGCLDIMSFGSPGAEISEGLHQMPEDVVVFKRRFSAFFGTGLADWLRERNITRVYLAGTQTPNCIRATAYDAISYDFDVTILSRCTSSADDLTQDCNLLDLERIGCEIED